MTIQGHGHTYDPQEYFSRPDTMENRRADQASYDLAAHGHHLVNWRKGRQGFWVADCRDCDYQARVPSRGKWAYSSGHHMRRCPGESQG